MLTEINYEWISSFKEQHQQLFTGFRTEGWKPGKHGSERETEWIALSYTFELNNYAFAMLLELGAIDLNLPHPDLDVRPFGFAPGNCYKTLMNASDDADAEVLDILDDLAFPVGEGSGNVLFVGSEGRSALINNALCGYARAPNPFILLDWYLLGKQRNDIEIASVPFGERITGRSW